MPVTKEELARRLRAAREACRMTQEDVARHLGVSRSAIAQIELGNRAVSSLELDKLAYLYGRDIREFLADEFREEDTLVARFRKHPEENVLAALRKTLALGRELTNLERVLEIAQSLANLLGAPEPEAEEACNEFRHRFLGLALEAFRREKITDTKLQELAAMVGVTPDQLDGGLGAKKEET